MNNTLDYYNNNANNYFENTVNGNMDKSHNLFLKHVKKNGYILDFGCGSGRDTKYFLNKKYIVKAIDGSIELSKLASNYTNQEVVTMNFLDFNEIDTYDGIWACSSLLHLNYNDFIIVLNKLINALKRNGILYISLKDGNYDEVINNKYYHYYVKEELDKLFNKLDILEYYNSRSTTNINETHKWHNYILKKR